MSADQIKPGNPGITGRAAGDQTIDFSGGAEQNILDGTRTASVDTSGGNIRVNLPKAQGYAGSSIAIDYTAGGNQVTLDPADGNTINGAADQIVAADGLLQLIPFGTNWRISTSA